MARGIRQRDDVGSALGAHGRRTRRRPALVLHHPRSIKHPDREAPMNFSFRFDPIELPPEAKELRQEVRTFLRQEAEAGTFSPGDGKGSFAREFSRRVGAKGWIGMTWPKKYGGH